VPYPVIISTEPPVENEDIPADKKICPPEPLFPEPTRILIAPERPDLAVPVLIDTKPLFPELEVPVTRETKPLTPVDPALAVFRVK